MNNGHLTSWLEIPPHCICDIPHVYNSARLVKQTESRNCKVCVLNNADVTLCLVSLSAASFENGDVILAVYVMLCMLFFSCEGDWAAVPMGEEVGGDSHTQICTNTHRGSVFGNRIETAGNQQADIACLITAIPELTPWDKVYLKMAKITHYLSNQT